jgi:hypothetical protein
MTDSPMPHDIPYFSLVPSFSANRLFFTHDFTRLRSGSDGAPVWYSIARRPMAWT